MENEMILWHNISAEKGEKNDKISYFKINF